MEEITIRLEDLAGVFGQNKDQFIANFIEKDETGNDKDLTPELFIQKLPDFSKTERQRFIAEGEKIGKRNRMAEFEANLRTKYNVAATAQGESLIDAIVGNYETEKQRLVRELREAKESGTGKGSLKEVSEDEAKTFIVNHPFYAASLAEKEALVAQKTAEFEQYKSEIETQILMSAVDEYALDFLHKDYRAIVPEEKPMADALQEAFLAKLRQVATFKKGEKGLEAFDKHGEPVKDENFRILTVAQVVESVAKNYFKQHPADPNKSAPGAGAGKQSDPDGFTPPDWSKMNAEIARQTILNEGDAAKRNKLHDSYQKYVGGK